MQIDLPSALKINLWCDCGVTEPGRKLASLSITYFPTPKTIFPSALTSAALFKCNYPPANLQEKKNNDCGPASGAVTGKVGLMGRESSLSSAALLSGETNHMIPLF